MPDRGDTQTIFLLSPAHSGGKRAQMVLKEQAPFPLAVRLREQGAPIGELFSFMSGLYFRGKLAYGRAFARARAAPDGVLVIVPGLGLVPPERVVTVADLETIASIGVAADDARFRGPLDRDAKALAARISGADRVVLLGSIATDKYVEPLEQHVGAHLHFPAEFVGRGDMSRGGLMLRCVQSGDELSYVRIAGATRRGPRPARLERMESGLVGLRSARRLT
ncbi:MAG TPA: hypothetical protein VJY35_02380 [Candidatus Eisenbacteria bacterium]|nr:hypothetical protein [Candidatus Eisenbacteria bacterium]